MDDVDVLVVEQFLIVAVALDAEGRRERRRAAFASGQAAATSSARGYSGIARARPYAEYQWPRPSTATRHRLLNGEPSRVPPAGKGFVLPSFEMHSSR